MGKRKQFGAQAITYAKKIPNFNDLPKAKKLKFVLFLKIEEMYIGTTLVKFYLYKDKRYVTETIPNAIYPLTIDWAASYISDDFMDSVQYITKMNKIQLRTMGVIIDDKTA